MKQKDFYYSMLYIYDKVLADALAEDFAKSGERSKSKYLADLISTGLAARQRASPTSAVNAEEVSERLSALERQNSALQSSVALDQTEQAAYRMLLCNVYYLLTVSYTARRSTANVWKRVYTTYRRRACLSS